MIIEVTYVGAGIGKLKTDDKFSYDTSRWPLPGDLVVAEVDGELRVIRYHSRMRKKGVTYEIKGVVI